MVGIVSFAEYAGMVACKVEVQAQVWGVHAGLTPLYRKKGVDQWCRSSCPEGTSVIGIRTQAEEVDDCKTILLSTELNSAVPSPERLLSSNYRCKL